MARQPCIECRRRPPQGNRRRCSTCQLRHEPIGDQVLAARLRLAMVPERLRVKRTPKLMRRAPAGTAWCAGCQSWRDHEDFAGSATTCRACASARQHDAMVAKVYGLTAAQYDALLALQGGRCAICRARPRSKRLAVDHDHASGAVRGLLCSRCNHELMGSAWDSEAIAQALLGYIRTPPAAGSWLPPETAPPFTREGGAVRPSKPSAPASAAKHAAFGKPSERPSRAPAAMDSLVTDDAAGIIASLDLDIASYQRLYGALGRHLAAVDPAPF